MSYPKRLTHRPDGQHLAASRPASHHPTALVPPSATGLTWTGEIPPQKWMNFYTKVLSKFAAAKGLKLKLTVEVAPEEGIPRQKLEESCPARTRNERRYHIIKKASHVSLKL